MSLHIHKYLAALWKDWVALMSGVASIILAFWAAFFPPPDITAGRMLLFICAIVCFLLASYRIWVNEYSYALKLEDILEEERKPRVSVVHFDYQPHFIVSKMINGRHYRILRVRVKNDGGTFLYSLRVQVKMFNKYNAYSGVELTLKEESLPIVQGHLIGNPDGVRPRPRNTFSLDRGEEQFVNVVMQAADENHQWNRGVELCLSAIDSDSYNNSIGLSEPTEFSIIVLGSGMPAYEKKFILYFDKKGQNEILCLKESDNSQGVDRFSEPSIKNLRS